MSRSWMVLLEDSERAIALAPLGVELAPSGLDLLHPLSGTVVVEPAEGRRINCTGGEAATTLRLATEMHIVLWEANGVEVPCRIRTQGVLRWFDLDTSQLDNDDAALERLSRVVAKMAQIRRREGTLAGLAIDLTGSAGEVPWHELFGDGRMPVGFGTEWHCPDLLVLPGPMSEAFTGEGKVPLSDGFVAMGARAALLKPFL